MGKALAVGRWIFRGTSPSQTILRLLVTTALVLGVFAVVLLALGKDPWQAYGDIIRQNLLNPRGVTELLVKMSPLLLTAVAVALPFKVGLINIGGEGQFFLGAWLGTWAALTFAGLPPALLLPLVLLMGAVGGALWGVIPGLLRAKGWVNETISTLLLNYVAPLIVGYFVFGPWRSPETAMYPQTVPFPPGARLPPFGDSRVHVGLLISLLVLFLYWFFVSRTKWGLKWRATGNNPGAARRLGLPVSRYLVLALVVGGGVAGLAGIAEVAAIHGRLKLAISPGYGYMGFLVNWLSGGNPVGIVIMAFTVALIAAGGFTLQITQRVPYAAVNILLALILFVVLAKPWQRRKG